ncbi:hypothetical protein M513_05467 [Trichuris suis]|uniref:PITH domain-containing protein n=1 Tax=Trichuris suis TaxID=68888 RepID=A0A085M8K5_9BILA|nr:hypothetical protein M513_05467 [Trichuris suis]
MRQRCDQRCRSCTGSVRTTLLFESFSKLLVHFRRMGNVCCSGFKSHSRGSKDRESVLNRRYAHSGHKGFTCSASSSLWNKDAVSVSGLQHIREREHDDVDQDPSTNPRKGPIFMERSESEMKLRENRRSCYFVDGQLRRSQTPTFLPLRKYNSCSTIFLDDSTISQPHLKNTVKCISLAIYYHISNRRNRGSERSMDIFDEQFHPITAGPFPPDYLIRDPDHRTIYRFVRTLFAAAQLTAECGIITLVYIERLLTYAEIDLCPENLKTGGGLSWEQSCWPAKNELERQFLECLEFNINVPSSVYAKYYFDLRTLAIANNLQLPLQPLCKERAKKLEALSRHCEDKLVEVQRKMHRGWSSADKIADGDSLLFPYLLAKGYFAMTYILAEFQMSDCHCGGAEHEHEHELEEEEEEKDAANMFSLYKYIDFENFTCLNELVDGSGKKVFRAWDKRMDRSQFVESDTDEELLFNLPFTGIVKLKRMVLIGGCAESRPTYARLFKNRPNMSFDETSGTPVQEFELKLDVEGQVPYSLRMAKFSDVHHLSIHIPRNAGADTTIVYYIGLDGYYVGPQRYGIPVVVDAVYEARPMPQDHKLDSLEHGNQLIM